MADTAALLEARDISVTFGTTRALSGVDLTVAAGECVGVVGRNGAGKSTIVSVLTGLRKPSSGAVFFDGHPAPAAGNPAAWQHHVSCVYQHSMLVPTLTVAENIFLNRAPLTRLRSVDWRAVRRQARAVLDEWNFDLPVDSLVSDISVEQRQVVEIARALSMGSRCLILDEPTAALEKDAVQRLFSRVRPLVDSGVGVIYISHHLEEVYSLCDRVVILRDGRRVLGAPTAELSEAAMVAAMVGESAPDPDDVGRVAGPATAAAPTRGEAAGAAPRLRVTALSAQTSRGDVDDVSLTVGRGELVGLVGLRGSGTTAVADLVAGLERPNTGTVEVDGHTIKPGSPATARDAGIGYVPEDRHARGFVPLLGVGENITMTIMDWFRRAGILSFARQHAAAARLVGLLEVKSAGLQQPVGELSGGNQQKVVVGRALARDPAVVVAVSPTQGVDVASKRSLMGSLRHACDDGAGVLLVSDDLDDLTYADRIVVMSRGRTTREFTTPPWNNEAVIAAAEGLEGSDDGPDDEK